MKRLTHCFQIEGYRQPLHIAYCVANRASKATIPRGCSIAERLFYGLRITHCALRNSVLAALVMLLLCLFTSPVWAQGNTWPASIDCRSAFPLCRVTLPASAAEATALLLTMDGDQPLPDDAYTVAVEETGAQVLFVWHEYVHPAGEVNASVRNPGATGVPRFEEFRSVVLRFMEYLDRPEFALDRNWLALIKSGDGQPVTDFPYIQPWLLWADRNSIYNQVAAYTPPADKNTPCAPLYALIARGLDAFAEAPGASPQTARHLVVFSNGLPNGALDGCPAEGAQDELPTLLEKTRSQQVTIHTVLLVSASAAGELAPTLEGNLRTLADSTGGQFVWLGEADPSPERAYEALTPIWQQIYQSRQQQVVTFDLRTIEAEQVQIRSQQGSASVSLPLLQLPLVTIVEITPNLWRGQEPITVQLQLEWPDGYAYPSERIAAIDYQLNGAKIATDNEAPFAEFSIAPNVLGGLQNGDYQLEVLLNDRLIPGAVAKSQRSERLQVALPPVPPTIAAALTPATALSVTQAPSAASPLTTSGAISVTTAITNDSNRVDQWFVQLQQRGAGLFAQLPPSLQPYGWLVGPALLLVGVILLGRRLLRSKPPRGPVIRTSDPPGEHTEPEDQTEPDVEGFPVARLVLEAGEGELPPELPLHPRHVEGQESRWKIGRSYQDCDCVIANRRVSRLHAVIMERDGHFFIQHEGSSGGTYVNKVPLQARVPELLADGDLLNFSTAVAYRFRIERDEFSQVATEPETGSAATEPEE
jgi:hypothetical protein